MGVRKAGATEWLNPSSGGGSGIFTVVASSDGDYETVSAALAAGASDIYIQTDITETTDGSFSDDTRIWLAPQIVWDLEDTTFTGAASVDIEIIGAPGSTLRYTRTAPATNPFTGVTTTNYTFRNIYVNNNSGVTSTHICNLVVNQSYENFEILSLSSSGAIITGSGTNVSFNNVGIISNGTALSHISLQGNGNVSDLYFTGTTPTGSVGFISLNGSLNGLRTSFVGVGSPTINIFMTETVSNIYSQFSQIISRANLLSNIYSSAAQFVIDGNGFSYHITNCFFSSYSFSSGTAPSVTFVNTRFTSNVITQVDNETYSGCRTNGITVNTDNVTVMGCEASFGAVGTITLNNGVDTPVVIGNKTNIAVVDNGAVGPQIIGNVII